MADRPSSKRLSAAGPLGPDERPSFIDRFPVLSEIGRGRNSVVYHGVDPRDKSAVAIKVIYALDGQQAPRELEAAVLREAEHLRALKHPNIVGICQAGLDHGHPYLVFPFVQGVTFEKALPAGLLDLRRALACLVKIAQAVHYAHGQGLIHRDLKPGNIILGSDGEPHVLDFGLGWRRGGKSQHGVQSIVGTPAYMSPEQARGEEENLTPATDVYSLGAILYEILTGLPPFHGETAWKTLQMAMQQPPVPPTQLDPNIDAGLERIVLWCLEKSPEKRYPSAEQLAQELQRILDGTPPKGPRISFFKRKLF